MGNAKIFIRERRKVSEGEKKPRYSVVGVAGTDLKIHVKHIRKSEIDQSPVKWRSTHYYTVG